MRILVADDDLIHIQLVSTRLRVYGFEVQVARDAMQAVMAAVRGKPAAILLDINMPGSNGIEALRQLKANSITFTIPVIVVSGSVDAELPKKLRALGAEDFLRKPFDFSELLGILNRVTGWPGERQLHQVKAV